MFVFFMLSFRNLLHDFVVQLKRLLVPREKADSSIGGVSSEDIVSAFESKLSPQHLGLECLLKIGREQRNDNIQVNHFRGL